MTAQSSLFDHLAKVDRFLVNPERTLCAEDERILEVWAEHGLPADLSTVEAAWSILLALWRSHQELTTALGDALDMPPGSARSYVVPCTWTSGEGEHRQTIPARLTISRTDSDGWWVAVTPEGWSTLWMSRDEAQPWGPWRSMGAPKRDHGFQTPRTALDAATATEWIGPAS